MSDRLHNAILSELNNLRYAWTDSSSYRTANMAEVRRLSAIHGLMVIFPVFTDRAAIDAAIVNPALCILKS
jgi:hypothetical protein